MSVFFNQGNGTFAPEPELLGVSGGARSAVGDLNGDGDLDILTNDFRVPVLFFNRGNENHFLRIDLVGIQSNRQGIGARLIASSDDGLVQMREVTGGNGTTQNEDIVHFGLGPRTRLDRLEVRWPSGQIDILTDIAADQQIRLFEGYSGYHQVRPAVWTQAPPPVLSQGSSLDLRIGVRPSPFSPEARTTAVHVDLNALGGPRPVPLVDMGDGTYELDPPLQITAETSFSIAVTLEQETEFGPHWSQLLQQVTVAPETDLPLFADRVEDGWTVEAQWLQRLTRNPGRDIGSSWFPDGQKILYISDPFGSDDGLDFELFTIESDGANPTNLTNNSAQEIWSQDVSPDGRHIVFHSNRDGQDDLYLMESDGSNVVRLTNDAATEHNAKFSPDGHQITYHANRDGNTDIFVMDADGSNHVRLTIDAANDEAADWSPDGQRLVFNSGRDDNRNIYSMDHDGGNLTQITRHGDEEYLPTWSPDGRQILFISSREGVPEVYLMDADGSNEQRLTHHPELDQWAFWAPDGKRIGFTSARADNDWELFVLELAGTERVQFDPDHSAQVYSGGTALEVRAQDHISKVLFRAPQMLDPSGYQSLHFAFHPGDGELADEPLLYAAVDGQTVDLLAGAWIDPAKRAWQAVEIPLGRFTLAAGKSFDSVVISGNLHGTFYIDEMRLTTLAQDPELTAVVETHSAATPAYFDLGQNFPNPFNPDTVIRFALPAAGPVQLAVYNIGGQKVATLAEGLRQAGSYTVRWDGRDDQGRGLASGVYLYKLQAGVQTESRKLLLLQ